MSTPSTSCSVAIPHRTFVGGNVTLCQGVRSDPYQWVYWEKNSWGCTPDTHNMIKTSDWLLWSIQVKYLSSNLSQSIVWLASCSLQPKLYDLGLNVKYESFNDSVTSLTKYKFLCGTTINWLVVRNDSDFNDYLNGFVSLQDTHAVVYDLTNNNISEYEIVLHLLNSRLLVLYLQSQ